MNQEPGDIEIKIGPDFLNHKLINFSVLASGYRVKNQGEGGIALLGPVRLDYNSCVAYLKYFSQALPKFLSS